MQMFVLALYLLVLQGIQGPSLFLSLPTRLGFSLKHLNVSPQLLAPPRPLFFLTHVPAFRRFKTVVCPLRQGC